MARIRRLSAHQGEQLSLGLREPFALLTGTPGTGKTYTLAQLIAAVVYQYGWGAVAVCAPTGKAAVRITQAMSRYGVGLAAKTVHSLLEIGRNGHDGRGWGFQRNAANPLDQAFVFVDEASMLDTDLFAALLRACRPGTHVLLVGDPNQLPPVGHGAPLRDLIAAGVCRADLSEIHRNDGGIVEACSRIKDGKAFEPGGNLTHVPAVSPADAISKLLAVLRRVRSDGKHGHGAGGASPAQLLADAQVIVATNTSGPLSRRAVNATLQEQLNPTGHREGANPFRTGDKVICTRNSWHMPEDQGEEVYVANGEIGEVIGVEARRFVAAFEAPRRNIRVPVGKPRKAEEEGEAEEGEGGTGCDFELGWAITCHKSQGSEWPVVIVLVDDSPGARRVCDRHWLYTAISRASQQTVLIGNLGCAQQMARRAGLDRRKTFMREQLA